MLIIGRIFINYLIENSTFPCGTKRLRMRILNFAKNESDHSDSHDRNSSCPKAGRFVRFSGQKIFCPKKLLTFPNIFFLAARCRNLNLYLGYRPDFINVCEIFQITKFVHQREFFLILQIFIYFRGYKIIFL